MELQTSACRSARRLHNALRITIGSDDDIDALLNALRRLTS